MPRIEFKEENIRKRDYDYPKFKLDKGETARIVLLEDPVGEFVHTIRKPKLVAGVPQKEVKKRRDGSEYEDYIYEFVAQSLCGGDFGILQENGSDPKNCAYCAEALKSDRFKAPKLRYAMHVVKYDTRPNSSDIKEPFGATTEVWGFTENVFGELFGFKKEWGDLRQHDLIVHREPNTYMSGVYKIQVSQKAEWIADKKRQDHVKALMSAENLAPDLSIFCGSKKNETQMGYDIRAVNEAWAIATGQVQVSAVDSALSGVGGGSLGLSSGLDDLMSSVNSTPAQEEKWAPSTDQPATSLSDLGIDSDESASDAPATDIDALLKGL